MKKFQCQYNNCDRVISARQWKKHARTHRQDERVPYKEVIVEDDSQSIENQEDSPSIAVTEKAQSSFSLEQTLKSVTNVIYYTAVLVMYAAIGIGLWQIYIYWDIIYTMLQTAFIAITGWQLYSAMQSPFNKLTLWFEQAQHKVSYHKEIEERFKEFIADLSSIYKEKLPNDKFQPYGNGWRLYEMTSQTLEKADQIENAGEDLSSFLQRVKYSIQICIQTIKKNVNEKRTELSSQELMNYYAKCDLWTEITRV